MDKFDCKIEDIETLEPDVEFIQNIYDNSIFISYFCNDSKL